MMHIYCTYMYAYGVSTISRLLKIIGLFCRISSLLYGSFAKETCHFKEPTNRSHPIHILVTVFQNNFVCTQRFPRDTHSSRHFARDTHFSSCWLCVHTKLFSFFEITFLCVVYCVLGRSSFFIHAHTHKHTYTHTHIGQVIVFHTRTHTQTHIHTHTHTYIHAHTHTHTYTHTHTNTFESFWGAFRWSSFWAAFCWSSYIWKWDSLM